MNAPTSSPVTAGKLPKGWLLSVFSDEISSDMEEQLEEVHRAKLKFFDLRSAFGKNVLDLNDVEADLVKKTGDRYGLKVLCIGSPINKHPYDPNDRARELERLSRIIQIANIVDARFIRIFTPLLGDAACEPGYDEIRDWMADQVSLAKRRDVVLLLENDADAYAAFPENAKRLFADLACDNFLAAYDFSNSVLIGYPALPHWFPWIQPYLGAIHAKDSIFENDEDGQQQILPSGQGAGCMKEILKVLVDSGWKGPVSIEPHLSRWGGKRGLNSVEQFRAALQGLNDTLEGLV